MFWRNPTQIPNFSCNDSHKQTLIITKGRGTKTVFLSLLKKKTSGIPQMIEKIWNAQQPFITAELRFNNIRFTNFKVLLYSRVFHFPQWLAILVTHWRMSLLQGLLLLWSVFSEPMLCQWRLLKPVPQIILCQRCNYCTTVTIVPSIIWVVRCTEDDVTLFENTPSCY